MIEGLQWTAIVLLAALLGLSVRSSRAASEREEQQPDPRLAELREVEERLAMLLCAVREDLSTDLATLAEMRAAVAEQRPTAHATELPGGLPAAEHPFEYKRVAPVPPRRDWSPDQAEALQLLSAGHDPDSVARRLHKSPHEIRLLARLAAAVQKPA